VVSIKDEILLKGFPQFSAGFAKNMHFTLPFTFSSLMDINYLQNIKISTQSSSPKSNPEIVIFPMLTAIIQTIKLNTENARDDKLVQIYNIMY